MDCIPPGPSVHGIFQASILECVPFPSPGDLPNPGIEARSPALQADSLPAEPRAEAQEYWSGLPFPSPGDLLDPGIEARSPALQADALTSEPPGKPFCQRLSAN